jgi:hypothetical protein
VRRCLPLLVLLVAALPGQPVAAAAPSPAPPRAPAHRIRIDVRGPLALIEVERSLTFGPEVGRAPSDEVVVDLDLPDDARLVDAQVRPAGTPVPPVMKLRAVASDGYGPALKTAQWRRAKVPIDEGADLRLLVAASGLGQGDGAAGWSLRYRFVAPLQCRADGDRATLVLRMPGSLDPAPAPAEVSVQVATGGAQAPLYGLTVGSVARALGGATRASLRTQVPTVAPWEVALQLGPRATASRRGSPAHAVAAAGATADGKRAVMVQLCRPPAPASASQGPPPGRLTLLLDRSRSVGPEGASVARDLARAIVEALPPSVEFNVLLFDRVSEPLFKIPRAATLEALRELEGAVGLGSLRNGTRPGPALRKAVELDARDARDSGPASRYWVMITDGALPDDQTAEALAAAVRPASRQSVEAAVLILRNPEDERAAPVAERALAAVPARLGGILRQLAPVGAVQAAPALVRAMREGGDLIDPRIIQPVGLQAQPFDHPAVAPGSGARLLAHGRAPAGGRLVVRAFAGGAAVSLAAVPLAVEAAWMTALAAEPRPGAAAWEATSAQALVRLAPVVVLPDQTVRGQMDKDVVHKALGYAFLPRARACYLTRAVKNAADFRLKGRMRLELHLERGEMMDAVIRQSTLGRPDIEACLREAAFTLDVPRAMHNDAPVVANLNLVFRPRTEASRPDASPLSAEIDRILGPMPVGSDPLELLIEGP